MQPNSVAAAQGSQSDFPVEDSLATVNKVTSSSREFTKRNTADFGDGMEDEELD